MSDVLFRTSLYGRFGHLVMAVSGLIFGVIIGFPLLFPGVPHTELLLLTSCGAMSIGALTIALYSIWFALVPGVRIICSNEALYYRGLFGSLNIPWEDLESARLNYAGRSPYVFLLVRRRGSRFVHKINVSGLTPTHKVLVQLVYRLAPHAVRPANGYGLAEAIVQEITDDM